MIACGSVRLRRCQRRYEVTILLCMFARTIKDCTCTAVRASRLLIPGLRAVCRIRRHACKHIRLILEKIGLDVTCAPAVPLLPLHFAHTLLPDKPISYFLLYTVVRMFRLVHSVVICTPTDSLRILIFLLNDRHLIVSNVRTSTNPKSADLFLFKSTGMIHTSDGRPGSDIGISGMVG